MKRIPSLDGLRAISIVLVVLHHLALARKMNVLWGSYGRTGVQIFFVISGYLITKILLRENQRTGTIDLREFYVRRAYRIFPAAYVFIFVGIVIYWRQLSWQHAAATLLYLSNFDHFRPLIFGHMWSLSVEEQFYLLWPGVLRRWFRHRTVILLAVVVFSPICHAFLYYLKVPIGGEDFFPVVAYNLAIGCLLAIFEPKFPRVHAGLAVFMLMLVATLPLFQPVSVPRTLLKMFVLQPLLCVAIAGLILHVVQVPYRILNFRPVVWLGTISYSLYLWQEPFCTNPRFSPLAAVALSLAMACLSYYLVERPMLRVRDRAADPLHSRYRKYQAAGS